MHQKIRNLGHYVLLYLRWAIIGIILLTVIIGIIGFAMKWSELVIHPELFLGSVRTIIEDIFSLLMVYEILDLIRTLSPNRLMDVLLTVLARKILLSTNEAALAIDIGAFVLILIPRILLIIFNKRIQGEIKEQ